MFKLGNIKVGDTVVLNEKAAIFSSRDAGELTGMRGVVIQVSPTDVEVRLSTPVKGSTDWYFSDYAIGEVIPARLFKVGDVVRVIHEHDYRHGAVGEVIEDDGMHEFAGIPYRVEFSDGGVRWFNADDIQKHVAEEVFEKEREFKVGDDVRVVASWSPLRGLTGEIIEDDGEDESDGLPYRVNVAGRGYWWFSADGLEPVAVRTFKVGDSVMYTGDQYASAKRRVGIVLQDDGASETDEMPYYVDFGDVKFWLNASELESKESGRMFKVGDTVRYVGDVFMGACGKVGVVLKDDGAPEGSQPYRVDFGDGVVIWPDVNGLVKVPELEAASIDLEDTIQRLEGILNTLKNFKQQ